MRRTVLACLGFGTLALAPILTGAAQLGCDSQPQGDRVIRAMQPIQGGTLDKTDANVVSIILDIPGPQGGIALCSGSLIGPNLVLSAHHCVATPPTQLECGKTFSATYAVTSFAVTDSYDAAAAAYNSNKLPTPDGVTWWGVSSVAVPGTNICGDDMSLLTLSQPMTGICPLIPAVDVAPTSGETYEAVGFGVTSPNGQAAGTRYDLAGLTVQCVGSGCANDPICQGETVTQCLSATAEFAGGSGPSGVDGTCEGDSGGPALDASNRVIGSVSRGLTNSCNETIYESVYGNAAWIKAQAQAAATAGGYTPAGWVTGTATSNPSAGYSCSSSSSSSSSSGATTSSSSSSSSSSSGSTSGSVPTTCSEADGTVGCCDGNVNYYCTKGGKLGSTNCSTAGGTCGWDPNGNNGQGWYDCTGSGADPSGTYPLACGGATTSSSSSSSTTSSSSSSSSSSTTSSSSGSIASSSSSSASTGTTSSSSGAAGTGGSTGTGTGGSTGTGTGGGGTGTGTGGSTGTGGAAGTGGSTSSNGSGSTSTSGGSTGGSGAGGAGAGGAQNGSTTSSTGNGLVLPPQAGSSCHCEAAGTQEGSANLSLSAFGMLALVGISRGRKRRAV